MGWITGKFFFYGFVFLGAVAGFFCGSILYSLLFIYWCESAWLLLALEIVLAVAGGLLCFKLKDALAIISTSILGAYALVKGISIMVGNETNEVALFKELQEGTA